jgi:hypothetical protein
MESHEKLACPAAPSALDPYYILYQNDYNLL